MSRAQDPVSAGLAASLAGLARIVSGARVRWAGSRPDGRQRVYFANHTSHLDAVVIWAVLPRRVRRLTRPVAAEDYWDRGWLRRYLAARVFDCVLVARGAGAQGAQGAVDLMVEALGTRHSLILFPEGTRGKGPQVGPFRSGLYHLAVRVPGLELVPVYLGGLYRILPKGRYLPVPLLSAVTFGPPLRLEPGEEKEAFLARARDALVGLARA